MCVGVCGGVRVIGASLICAFYGRCVWCGDFVILIVIFLCVKLLICHTSRIRCQCTFVSIDTKQ